MLEFKELVDCFAQKLGIAGLAPDENGTVKMSVDGMRVEILHDAPGGSVLTCAEIGEPPPEGSDRFAAVLLRANFMFQGTDGATLSQNPETKAYALIRPFALDGLDVDTFADQFGKFVDCVERWRQVISDFRSAEEAAPSEDLDPNSPFGGDGFMAV